MSIRPTWTGLVNLPGNCPWDERLITRRRARRRPLTGFASRSPLAAFGVWLLRAALIALITFGVWLLIANWALPTLVDGIRP